MFRLLRSCWIKLVGDCGERFSQYDRPWYVCQRGRNHSGDHRDYNWADAQPHAPRVPTH
jgi:hypothetical protein